MKINKKSTTTIIIPFSGVPKGNKIRITGKEIKNSTIMYKVFPNEDKNLNMEDPSLGRKCKCSTNMAEITNNVHLTKGRIVLYSATNEDLSQIKATEYTSKNKLVNHLKTYPIEKDDQ